VIREGFGPRVRIRGHEAKRITSHGSRITAAAIVQTKVNVPNYIPQQLEVPGNVTLEKWDEKLAFLRRVTVWHLASVGLLLGLTKLSLPETSLTTGLWLLVANLAVLCVARIATRGTEWDQRISAPLAPLALVPLALVIQALHRLGYPVWAPLSGLAAAAAYTLTCRRDFSFIGQFLLSLIASEVGLAIVAPILGFSPIQAAWAMGLSAAYLLFYCYDLASLMSRRRRGEALASAVDLYRDSLNVFGWIVRCVRHWQRHRIWTMPWT
jgi:FtsH-binding integral membrane protein